LFHGAFCCVEVEEECLRFASSFKSNFAFGPVNAFSALLLGWKNHEIHLLQIASLRQKGIFDT
jgi:hypothetical protein